MNFFKHPFLNLRIGLVLENYAIVKNPTKSFGKQEVLRGFVNIPFLDINPIPMR